MDWIRGRGRRGGEEGTGEEVVGSRRHWVPTSDGLLQAAEAKMLEGVRSKVQSLFVKLSDGSLIRTVHTDVVQPVNSNPVVLVHGFAAGLAFWTFNIDPLSQKQNVYAIDLLGFGRSSRPDFPSSAEEVEERYVSSLEEWREQVGLEKVVLCGHSFGGYLACCYALRHPERVAHLVLADPWGFPEQPPPGEEVIKISKFRRAVFSVLGSFNPFAMLRLAGPYGPSLINKVRPDIKAKYEAFFGEGDSRVMDYIYHCNAQKPSGEGAFMSLTSNMVYAKNPMINRIKDIDHSIPITILYGKDSWMMKLFDFERVLTQRPAGSAVKVNMIPDAGHHIYADQKDVFNEHIIEICNRTELAKSKSSSSSSNSSRGSSGKHNGVMDVGEMSLMLT